MLRIEHLTKTYGAKRAVDDLCLCIAPGEIRGFIGHNGAGKTTTLKACCGILDFDGGEISVCGHSIKKEPLVCKKQIAYLPDNPDLYDFLTGRRYLDFIADIFEVPADVRRARIGKYAEMFGIENDLGTVISSYSHGMKQKLAVTSALIHDPKLLVMDEPFVGLDPKAAFDLKCVMHELCAQGGAIFFSTHVLDVAQKLCDRVAIIRNGKLVAEGATDEVCGSESLEEVFLELEENHA